MIKKYISIGILGVLLVSNVQISNTKFQTISKFQISIPKTHAEESLVLAFGEQLLPSLIQKKSQWDFAKLWEQDLSWGVIALNPDKAIYKPGETAFVSIGVLDEEGKQTCYSSMELEVWGPPRLRSGQASDFYELKATWRAGGIIKNDKECNTKGYTDAPDFYTTVPLGDAGTYDVRLTVRNKNGERSVTDTWIVSDTDPLFSIQRQGPTRTYPSATYTMRVDIIPREDFRGTVTETLPATFKIAGMTPQGSVGIQPFMAGITSWPEPTPTTLKWKVNWKAGETYSLLYDFQSYGASPEFYRIAPMAFMKGNAEGVQGTSVYAEPRSWQIANDDSVTDLLPQSDGDIENAGWIHQDTNACNTVTNCWEEVNDPAGSPDDLTSHIFKGTETNADITFNIDTSGITDLSTITAITVVVHCSREDANNGSSGTGGYQIDGAGFVPHGTPLSCPGKSGTWGTNTFAFTGLSIEKIVSADIEVGFRGITNREIHLSQVYASLIEFTLPVSAASDFGFGYMWGDGGRVLEDR